MKLGARHHILYVGFWALNAARAEDMGGGGLYMGGGGGHGRENVGGGFSREVVEVQFHGDGPSGTHHACQGPICILKAQLFQNANADAGDKRY